MPMTQNRIRASANESPYRRVLQSIGNDLRAVDDLLAEKLETTDEPLIPELARHLIEAGGKRLRPVLTLAVARTCGYRGEDHIRLAAAVELIHSATLLHDDVVDSSTMRRGRASANTVWGNKLSILVGDFLFSRSFQLMVDTSSLRVLSVLADASAVIAEGEVMQTASTHDLDTGDQRYIQMIGAKTAALFAAATEVGACIARAEMHVTEAFRTYGHTLGVAFQLADDALDYSGRERSTGKSVGDDFNGGKATLPVLVAYREGTKEARQFWRRTITEGIRREGDFVHAQELLSQTSAIEKTLALADDYAEQARTALGTVPNSPSLRALADLPSFAVSRSS